MPVHATAHGWTDGEEDLVGGTGQRREVAEQVLAQVVPAERGRPGLGQEQEVVGEEVRPPGESDEERGRYEDADGIQAVDGDAPDVTVGATWARGFRARPGRPRRWPTPTSALRRSLGLARRGTRRPRRPAGARDDHELVAEQGRPHLDAHPVEPGDEALRTAPRRRWRRRRAAGRPARCGRTSKPGVGDAPRKLRAGEEAHVAVVEDAALVVVEAAERDAAARVPVAEVRDADDAAAPPARAGRATLASSSLGLAHVLEHVGGDDDVEAVADLGAGCPARGRPRRTVDAARSTPSALDEVDAGDVVARAAQQLGRGGRRSSRGRAPATAAGAPSQSQHAAVRAVVGLLQLVVVGANAELAASRSPSCRAR